MKSSDARRIDRRNPMAAIRINAASASSSLWVTEEAEVTEPTSLAAFWRGDSAESWRRFHTTPSSSARSSEIRAERDSVSSASSVPSGFGFVFSPCLRVSVVRNEVTKIHDCRRPPVLEFCGNASKEIVTI